MNFFCPVTSALIRAGVAVLGPLVSIYFYITCTKCPLVDLYLSSVLQSALSAGLVCKQWTRGLLFIKTWSHLHLHDNFAREAGMCHYRFNLYNYFDEVNFLDASLAIDGMEIYRSFLVYSP